LALSPHVLGRWLFSHEEDGARVYRPRDAEFAPSRQPRDGFDIAPDGQFRGYRSGAGDAPIATDARWREAGAGALEIVGGDGAVVRTIEIVSAQPGVLKVRG
jgi:hypothetical protein